VYLCSTNGRVQREHLRADKNLATASEITGLMTDGHDLPLPDVPVEYRINTPYVIFFAYLTRYSEDLKWKRPLDPELRIFPPSPCHLDDAVVEVHVPTSQAACSVQLLDVPSLRLMLEEGRVGA
jgi:hypothetical protein